MPCLSHSKQLLQQHPCLNPRKLPFQIPRQPSRLNRLQLPFRMTPETTNQIRHRRRRRPNNNKNKNNNNNNHSSSSSSSSIKNHNSLAGLSRRVLPLPPRLQQQQPPLLAGSVSIQTSKIPLQPSLSPRRQPKPLSSGGVLRREGGELGLGGAEGSTC